MAKSRAQRKAERKAKEQQAAAKQGGADAAAAESHAQHDTQVPISGEVAEVEAVIETGAKPSDYGEHTVAPTPDVPSGDQPDSEIKLESASAPAVPGVTGGIEAAPVTPDTEPSDAGAGAEGATTTPPKPGKETRRQRKRFGFLESDA